MRRAVFTAILLTSVTLSACGLFSKKAATTTNGGVSTAVHGTAASTLLATENLLGNAPAARPSPILGVYASMFLSTNAMQEIHTALLGVQSQLALYFSQQAAVSDASATVEQLGTTLQVNIADMLNRSDDRAKALDDYLTFLDTAMKEATVVHDSLDEQRKEADTQVSAARSDASTLKQQVDKAISSKDFSTAGEKQELLGIAQTKQSQLTSQRDQLLANVSLIEKLLGIAEQRQTAITNNRQVLIAGLSVVNVPGVSDLGILQTGGKQSTGAFSF